MCRVSACSALTLFSKLIEAILNPRLQINPWLKRWCEDIKRIIEERMPEDEQSWAWVLGVILRLPDLVRFDPELLHEARTMYDARSPELGYLRRHLVTATTAHHNSSSDNAGTTGGPATNETARIIARRQCLYGFGLTMSILLNTILRAYDSNDVSLVDESNHVAREIITLAKQASIYRPLGAAYMSLCLMSAWTASADTDLSTHTEVETVLAEYQLDFLGPRAMEGCIKMMLVIRQLRTAAKKWRMETSDMTSSGSFTII